MQLLGAVNQPPPGEVGTPATLKVRVSSPYVGYAGGGGARTRSQHVCGVGGCSVHPAGHESPPPTRQSCVCSCYAHSSQQRRPLSWNKVSLIHFDPDIVSLPLKAR